LRAHTCTQKYTREKQNPALLLSASLARMANYLPIFLMTFSTPVLKLSFSQSLCLYSYLSLPHTDLLELWPLIVWHSLTVQ